MILAIFVSHLSFTTLRRPPRTRVFRASDSYGCFNAFAYRCGEMTWSDKFLEDRVPKTWSGSEGLPASVVPRAVFVQGADAGLEVAVANVEVWAVKREDMRKAWKARQGGPLSPPSCWWLDTRPDIPSCSAFAVRPGWIRQVHFDLEISRVERLAATALNEPSRHAAQRCLARTSSRD